MDVYFSNENVDNDDIYYTTVPGKERTPSVNNRKALKILRYSLNFLRFLNSLPQVEAYSPQSISAKIVTIFDVKNMFLAKRVI